MKKVILSILLSVYMLSNAFAYDVANFFPNTFSYQGYLTDNTGIPINTSTSIKFEIIEGQDVLWDETMDVPVSNGLFNVVLGGGINSLPPTLFRGRNLQIRLTVEGELMASQPITSVPFAHSAKPDTTVTVNCSVAGSADYDSIGAALSNANMSTDYLTIQISGNCNESVFLGEFWGYPRNVILSGVIDNDTRPTIQATSGRAVQVSGSGYNVVIENLELIGAPKTGEQINGGAGLFAIHNSNVFVNNSIIVGNDDNALLVGRGAVVRLIASTVYIDSDTGRFDHSFGANVFSNGILILDNQSQTDKNIITGGRNAGIIVSKGSVVRINNRHQINKGTAEDSKAILVKDGGNLRNGYFVQDKSTITGNVVLKNNSSATIKFMSIVGNLVVLDQSSAQLQETSETSITVTGDVIAKNGGHVNFSISPVTGEQQPVSVGGDIKCVSDTHSTFTSVKGFVTGDEDIANPVVTGSIVGC